MSTTISVEEAIHHSVEQFVLDLRLKAEQLEITADELSQMGAFDKYWMTRERFEAFEPVLRQERNWRMQQTTRTNLQASVRRSLMSAWLDGQSAIKSPANRESISQLISLYLREDRERDLAAYLKDVAKFGYDDAEKNRKKRDRATGYLGYLGVGVFGVLRLGILFLLFSAASSKFEVIVFALLALVLSTVGGHSRESNHQTIAVAFAHDNQFKRILKLLNLNETDSEREVRCEEESTARGKIARSHSLLLVEALFSGLAWLYAFVMLMLAVL